MKKSRDGSHFERLIHPLQRAEGEAEIKDYPFPSGATSKDIEEARAKVIEIHKKDLVSAGSICPAGGTIFWPALQASRDGKPPLDFYAHLPLAVSLLERVTEIASASRIHAETALTCSFLQMTWHTNRPIYEPEMCSASGSNRALLRSYGLQRASSRYTGTLSFRRRN